MESKPHVRLSATQGTLPAPPKLAPFSSSSSLSGSLPIRAPPTPDSDSDSESNGHKSCYSTSSNISSIGFDGSESEAFVTGEEFETASERPFAADPDEETPESFELSLDSEADPDGYESAVEKVMVGDEILGRVMPIAKLSWDSDDNDVVGSEGVLSEVEDGEFSGRVKVNGFVERLSTAPRVKVFEVEEGEEDESVKWEECLLVEQSEDFNDLDKCPNEDCVQAEWVEDNEASSVGLSINVLEGGVKGKHVEEEFFVHCPNSERNGIDLGVAGNENDIVDSTTYLQRNLIEERLSVAPRVKVFEVEEDESVEWEECMEVKGVESFDYNDLGKGLNGDCVQPEWNGVDLCVLGSENDVVDSTAYSQRNLIEETLYLGNCDVSELTKDGEFENALCSDFLESITLSSLSVTLLCENVADNAGTVQFQGDAAYGANVEVPLMEKDFLIEPEQTGLGLPGEEMISTAPGVMVLEEGEEYESGLWKESLQPAIEVNCVEGSDLNSFVKAQKGDTIQAEIIEDKGLVTAEINEPNFVELNIGVCEGGENAKYVAEESIVHCTNRGRDGVDVSGSSEALERGMHSGIEENENQIQETVYLGHLGNGDLSEATKCDRFEFALCSDFLRFITPSSNVTHKHICRDEDKLKSFKINGTTAGITVTLSDENAVTGLKIDNRMAIGKRMVLAGSAGALQFDSETAHGAKLEVHLKDEDFPIKQNQSSLGLSLMKWGGGLVLTTDILSLFSVGTSKMAVHVVLNNKQRGQIAIRTNNSNQLQSALVGILSIAVSIFGIFRPRFGGQSST